jgi:ABC-2 type transport system permease protein
MSTLAVARKDFDDSRRSRVLLLVVGVFVVFAAGTAFVYGQFLVQEVSGELTTNGLIQTMTAGFFPLNVLGITPVHVFLPFVGILLGYRAVVRERESGEIKLSLSLPNSRAEMVAGKLLGRTSVALAAMLVGFALAALVGIVLYQSFDPVAYLGFILATALFVLTYVSIGVGISAASPNSSVALTAVIAYLLIFHALWGGVFWFVRTFALNIGQGGSPPDWFLVAREFNPARAYNHVVDWFVPGATGTTSQGGAGAVLPEPAFLLFMGFWIVVPLALGYLRFEAVDL